MIPSAVRVLAEFKSSSTLPALVETSQGMKCVVKWKGGAEGPLAIATEWISLKLAQRAGVPVLSPHLLSVSHGLASATDNGELRDIIRRSTGINLGIDFLENATPASSGFLSNTDSATANLIFLFDLLLLNIDRTDLNHNLVVSKGHLYCIDFAASMAVKKLMTRTNHSEQALLNLLRRHPFYSPGIRAMDFSFAVEPELMEEITRSLPEEWLIDTNVSKADLASGLVRLLKNSLPTLEHRLAILKSTPLESIESIRARALKNKKAFLEKLESGRKSRIL